MLVIGKHPVLELLKSTPKSLNKIILLKTLNPERKSREIVRLAEENSIRILYLSREDFGKYFNNKNKSEGITQGVLGFIKEYKYFTLKEIIKKAEKIPNPLLLILDEITDPHNMGAIIRSAVCLGADGIIIPRHNSAEVNHTVIKTSSGSVNFIPIAKETNISNAIDALKFKGFTVIGTDSSASQTIFEIDFKKPVVLVIGSEGKGIRKKVRSRCDLLTRIPLMNRIESLNASVSAGIFLYEIFRQKNS